MRPVYWTWLALAAAALSAGCGDDGGTGGAGAGGSGGEGAGGEAGAAAGGEGGAGGEAGAGTGGGAGADTGGDGGAGAGGDGSAGAGGDGGAGAGEGGRGGDGGHGSIAPCDPPDPALASGDADALFAGSDIPRFDFHLPEARWNELKANARAEEYVEAEACYQGKSLGVVGLRFKGGYGTLELCFDGQGQLICPKLSMKVKFDEYVDGQRFYQQRRLNFHAMIRDPTKLRERIAYGLYREMGVPAPRSAWATLHVNGESQGLFSMVEDVDSRFVKSRFPDDPDGNLYKEAWPISTEPEDYASHIETNEDTATHEGIAGFAEALLSAEGEARLAALSQRTDLAQLQRYMAVDEAIVNWDGVTTFYVADEDSAYNHNFYLYEAPSSGTFHLIPWDLDNTLSLNNYFGDVPRWLEAPDACPSIHAVFTGQEHVRAAGCDPLFAALRQDAEGYRRALAALLDGPLRAGGLEEQVRRYAELLRASIADDPFGPGLVAWESWIDRLERDLPVLRERVSRFATGTPVVPFKVAANAVNDFEAVDELGLLTGTQIYTNDTSTGVQGLTQEDPLSGAQSLHLRFELRDEATPWSQYAYFTMPLHEPLNARGLAGIRFLARADEDRMIRFEVESPAHTATDAGVRYGWDVPLTQELHYVQVLFADIAVPDWARDLGLDPGDDVNAVLGSVIGLAVVPWVNGRNEQTGFLPEGAVDSGAVELDDIEFFTIPPAP